MTAQDWPAVSRHCVGVGHSGILTDNAVEVFCALGITKTRATKLLMRLL